MPTKVLGSSPRNSRQNVAWCNCGAEGAFRSLPNPPNKITPTLRTAGNFPRLVELDVGRQVIREMDGGAVGQTTFQSELIRSGINLAEIIDAGIGGSRGTSFDKIGDDEDRNTYGQ